MTFTVYSARMVYNDLNKLVGTVEASDLKGAKEAIKNELHLNPYYTVIVDHSNGAKIVLYNEFLQFVK